MLSLTASQETVRRRLLEDHVEPLYWMRVEHEVLLAVAVSATNINGRTLTLTPDVSSASSHTGFPVTSSSTEAAEGLVEIVGSRAFRRGNVVYIRAAFQDSVLNAGGDLIASGDASVLYATPRGSEFVSGAHDIVTPPDFVRFDTAPNEYIDYGQTDDLASESLATWSGWVRLSSNFGTGYTGNLFNILRGGGGWRFSVTTGRRALVQVYNASLSTAQETSTAFDVFVPGQWHHFAATFSGGTVVLYVDGLAIASSTTGTMPSAIQPAIFPLPFTPGLVVGENFGQHTNSADLKHLAYWAGTAATAAQVAELYGLGTPPDLETLPTLAAPTFWAPLNGTYDLRLGSQSPTVVGSPAFGPEGHATASILDASTMGIEKDPWTKEVSATSRSVALRGDAAVLRLLTENVLLNREVSFRRGLLGYPISSWIPSGSYIITDGPIPTDIESTAEQGFSAYRIKMRDKIGAILENAQIVATEDNEAFLTARHPVEQAKKLLDLAVYQSSGPINPSAFLDDASFDPSDAQWSDVSHFSSVKMTYKSDFADVSWGFAGVTPPADIEYRSGFVRPERISRVLDDLRTLIPGQVAPEEDGKVRARRIDYSSIPGGTATVYDWTEEFEAEEAPDLMVDLVNEIIVDLSGDVNGEEWEQSYVDRNLSSIRAHGIPGASPTSASPRGGLRSDSSVGIAFGGKSYVLDATNGAPYSGSSYVDLFSTAVDFRVMRQGPFGFSGGRSDLLSSPPYTMPSWAQLGSGRVALFRLESQSNAPRYGAYTLTNPPQMQPRTALETVEYIECNASALDGTSVGEGYGTELYGTHGRIRYTISKRAALGTTTPDVWTQYSKITDCTIARALTAEYLDRWGWGFPTVKGRTRLGLIHHQVGDFVQVSLPRLVGLGGQGADSLGLVFEIVGKEESYDRITWRLALASRLTPYVAIRQHQIPSFTISAGGEGD